MLFGTCSVASGSSSHAEGYATIYSREIHIICEYLNEEEIRDFLNKIIDRSSNSDNYEYEEHAIKNIVTQIIGSKHFSEEFLLEFTHLINERVEYTLMRQHRQDIESGNYPNIALMIEGLKW